jgi:hypothetical protein
MDEKDTEIQQLRSEIQCLRMTIQRLSSLSQASKQQIKHYRMIINRIIKSLEYITKTPYGKGTVKNIQTQKEVKNDK